MIAPHALFCAAAASLFTLVPHADAQIDAIRAGREILRRAPSLESVFGKEQPITSGIEDAKDGVPSMDGFNPPSYSPMQEMPFAQDGSILLVPGAYFLSVEGFCLRAGTFGPQSGKGYLHVEWKGPRANLVTSLLNRYPYHPEIKQRDLQVLLWAIILRSNVDNLQNSTKAAAVKLLTPAELLELKGYSLDVVSNSVRDRVLQSAPAPVRRLLTAENEMRRLLHSADASYADLERTAVLTGAIPANEATFIIPEGRWSYHPGGFFIKYLPFGYTQMHVAVYYPDKVEIRRDASGRIISIASTDGRRVEPVEVHNAHLRFAHSSVNAMRSVTLVTNAMRGGSGDARLDLLALAEADYFDLAAIRKATQQVKYADRALVEEAEHAALARYMGIARLPAIERGSPREKALRPIRTTEGYAYVVDPAAAAMQHPGRMMPLNPGGGGAAPTGPSQRLALTRKIIPMGGQNPGTDQRNDVLDKAQKSIDAINAMNSAKDFFSGGALDKAAMGAGMAQEQAGGDYGAMTSPSGMLGAGLKQAFNAARQIANSMGGGSWLPGIHPGHDVASTNETRTVLIPVSYTPMRAIGIPVESPASRWDYRVLSKPRSIEFRPFTSTAYPAHARAANALIRSTFETAMLLEAWALAETRFAEAVNARDLEWQDKQGLALVYLKRATGLAMIQLSKDFAVARGLPPTRDELIAAQNRLRASRYAADVQNVSRQLGMTGADLEALRQQALGLDPAVIATEFYSRTHGIVSDFLAYGNYLALLPAVKAPWDLPGSQSM